MKYLPTSIGTSSLVESLPDHYGANDCDVKPTHSIGTPPVGGAYSIPLRDPRHLDPQAARRHH
eukprot:1016075-Lingulodinium_polyedra.AAC.1